MRSKLKEKRATLDLLMSMGEQPDGLQAEVDMLAAQLVAVGGDAAEPQPQPQPQPVQLGQSLFDSSSSDEDSEDLSALLGAAPIAGAPATQGDVNKLDAAADPACSPFGSADSPLDFGPVVSRADVALQAQQMAAGPPPKSETIYRAEAQAIEFGFSTEQIEKAQAWRLENAGVYYDDAEQLITAILAAG
jgi:hypothetical protein